MPAGAAYGYPGLDGDRDGRRDGPHLARADPASDRLRPRRSAHSQGERTDNCPADQFGNAVAQRAIDAVSGNRGLLRPDSLGRRDEQNVDVENTNPVLLAPANEPANSTPLGGTRSTARRHRRGATATCSSRRVTTLRVGDIPFYGVPGEPYPSIKFSLDRDVHAPVQFIFGLANDQLGYAEEPSDYNGALPVLDQRRVVLHDLAGLRLGRRAALAAQRQGARLQCDRSALSAYGPGKIPPVDQLHPAAGSSSPALPVGMSRLRDHLAAVIAAGWRPLASPAHAPRPILAALVNPLDGALGAGFPVVGRPAPVRDDPAGPGHRAGQRTAGPRQLRGYSYQDPADSRVLADPFRRCRDPYRRRPAVHADDRAGRPVRSTGYASPYSHASEMAQPGYYAVSLHALPDPGRAHRPRLARRSCASPSPRTTQANVLAEVSQSINASQSGAGQRRGRRRAPGLDQIGRRLHGLLRRRLRPPVQRRRDLHG